MNPIILLAALATLPKPMIREVNLGFMNIWSNNKDPLEWTLHKQTCTDKDEQRYLVTDNGNHEYWRCTKCNIKWEIDMS